MMVNLKQSWLVWSLLLCLVLVNGFLAVPAVAHADHHAKHQAGTHSTGLCAWECAAGQSIDTAGIRLMSSLRLTEIVEHRQSDFVRQVSATSHFLRGPPSLSFN
ncbi:MAG: hypothetical protein HOP35_06110 [Nitrospira sp.]|nr:hypothetical protein [Nitrospira sp.]